VGMELEEQRHRTGLRGNLCSSTVQPCSRPTHLPSLWGQQCLSHWTIWRPKCMQGTQLRIDAGIPSFRGVCSLRLMSHQLQS
jgi:hypothetical protein